jgi:hypothetical protein
MNNCILSIDIAKKNSDSTCLCIQFANTCLEETKELWSIGDEYLLSEFYKRKFGLNNDNKLIISAIYENDKQDVFMNMLIK